MANILVGIQDLLFQQEIQNFQQVFLLVKELGLMAPKFLTEHVRELFPCPGIVHCQCMPFVGVIDNVRTFQVHVHIIIFSIIALSSGYFLLG